MLRQIQTSDHRFRAMSALISAASPGKNANGRFDWLISEHQSVNPSREAISILSGKQKHLTVVQPVSPELF